jgi:hypothetical protein
MDYHSGEIGCDASCHCHVHIQGAPRQGHLDRAKRIFGYVDRYKEAGIRVRPGMPDYCKLDKIYKKYYWSDKVYGTQHEEFPMNMPEPLGGMMRITQYVDANLYFDLVSGRACTGILTFLNQTPVDWYS